MSSISSEESLEKKYKLVADTIRVYPLQIKQAWDDIKQLHIPNEYKDIDNVIFCGMGGSALGSRMVKAFAQDRFRVPFEIYNNYKIPNYVNNKTLVIVSSYSGTTEETIESFYQALKKQAKIFGITTGGTLADLLVKEKAIPYVFEPRYNPFGQPRMSIGYAVGATLAILNKLGVMSVIDDEVDAALTTMQNALTEYNENVPIDRNLPLNFAKKLRGKSPIFVASEHLFGVAHTVKNQFNESSKTFSVLFEIPELNHHLMEGLKNPTKLREVATFVFFESDLYLEKIKKRHHLTEQIVEKNGIDFLVFSPTSTDRLSQVLETLIFGSFVVYHLTRLYEVDPIVIPWVDYFKKELAKT